MQRTIFSLIVFILTVQSNLAVDITFDSLNSIYNSKYELSLKSSADTLGFTSNAELFKQKLLFDSSINSENFQEILEYVAQCQALRMYDLACSILNNSISLTQSNSISKGFFYFKKGDIKQSERKEVQALENYLKASLIFEQLSDMSGAAYTNLRIAMINFNGLNNAIAIRYADQSISKFNKFPSLKRNDSINLSFLYSIIGVANRRLGLYDSALINVDKSIAISRLLGDSLRIAMSNGNKAAVFVERGDLDLAEPLLLVDFNTSLENKVYISAFNAGVTLGDLYLQKEEQEKLISIFEKLNSLKDSLEFDIPPQSLQHYFNLASKFYNSLGKDSMANFYLSKVAQINRRIDSSQRANDFDRLQEKYLMEKEITKLELLQKTNELQSSHLKLRTTLLILIAFALIIVLWYVYVLRHKNRKIDKLNELLEVKVSERTTRLMEINKELDNYLYRASHDIRRPIRTLLGLNNVVKFTKDPDELKALFAMVYDTAMNMDEMLFKLQMAYELNNTHEIEHVAIYDLIADSLNGLERLIELKNAKIFVDKNEKAGSLMANNALLKIAIDNIVENALIYHNQEQPEVIITTDEGKYYFYIHIHDTGYGIDEAYQEKIFTSYFKISNKTQGSGLGLFLAHKAISFLAGEIMVESVINEGSKFTIKVPISPK